MKIPNRLTLSILSLALAFSFLVIGCNKGTSNIAEGDLKNSEINTEANSSDCSCIINPSDEISPEEEEILKYMREEEKLARDVYITFFEQYSLNAFDKISKSEQKHMDRILCLLEYYNIEDPASSEIGVFNNFDLQELYNSLVEQGEASLTAALTVGATIEDVDIHDINQALDLTENEAIIVIFDHLKCGSENHMRAFVNLLENNDSEYDLSLFHKMNMKKF